MWLIAENKRITFHRNRCNDRDRLALLGFFTLSGKVIDLTFHTMSVMEIAFIITVLHTFSCSSFKCLPVS